MKRMTLRRGDAWVDLRPLSPTLAQVKDASVLYRGDIVQAPPGTTWESLSERGEDGQTLGHPSELEILFDAVTCHLEPAFDAAELSAAMEVADPRAMEAFAATDARVDLEALLRRFSDDEAEVPAARAERRGVTPNRTKRDVA